MKPLKILLLSFLFGPLSHATEVQGPDLSIVVSHVKISWNSQSNHVYQLQYRSDLSGPTWRDVAYPIRGKGERVSLIDVAGGPKGFYRVIELTNVPVVTNMVWIPPGTFTMGSPGTEVDRWPNEGPLTEVTISQGFWMSTFEVTQEEYLDVVGENPSNVTGSRHPVETVAWSQAMNYCALLTSRERGAGRISESYEYRLPTEAEWEYACRAGTTTRFPYGDDPGYSEVGDYSWYFDNSGHTTHPVGLKRPNPWGLYDMQGNVREWCLTFYSDILPGGSVVDPTGPDVSPSRAVRGADYRHAPEVCRSAFRNYHPADPGLTAGNVGFRVVLSSAVQTP